VVDLLRMAHVLKRDLGMGTEEGGTDLIYLAMGLCCGLFFLVLMSIVFGLPRFFRQTRLPVWSVPACGGLIVGLIGLLSPQALGLGYTTINQALTGELTLTLAASLVVFKILTTGFSLGSGMSGGIFAPSLFLGAMVGALFGHAAQFFWPLTHDNTAYFSLIGMGAMVSGTTLAPITAIMTIFELTNNFEVILPLMVACIPSILVVQALHGYSIYETNLINRGINIVRGRDINRLRSMRVTQYMYRDFEPIVETTPLGQVAQRIAVSNFPHFIMVNDAGEMTGVLTLRDLRSLLGQNDKPFPATTPASELMQREVITLDETDNLETAFHLFAEHKVSFLPVTSSTFPNRVLGYLKKSDLVAAYDQQILKDRILPTSSRFSPLRRKTENKHDTTQGRDRK
jgi:chloride channel protein, CIC family